MGRVRRRIDREHDGVIHVEDLRRFFGESIPVGEDCGVTGR